ICRCNRALHKTVDVSDTSRGDAFLDHVERTVDALQKVVEIMGDAAGKLPDCFHLLTLTQRLFGLHKLCGSFLHALLERRVQVRQGKGGGARLTFAGSKRGFGRAPLVYVTTDRRHEKARVRLPT